MNFTDRYEIGNEFEHHLSGVLCTKYFVQWNVTDHYNPSGLTTDELKKPDLIISGEQLGQRNLECKKGNSMNLRRFAYYSADDIIAFLDRNNYIRFALKSTIDLHRRVYHNDDDGSDYSYIKNFKPIFELEKFF